MIYYRKVYVHGTLLYNAVAMHIEHWMKTHKNESLNPGYQNEHFES